MTPPRKPKTSADGDSDRVVKRHKTSIQAEDKPSSAAYTMDINLAVTTEYENAPLSEIVKAPVSALQGIGPKSEAALAELEVVTVEDLGTYKYFKMARAITTLAATSNGKRGAESKFNVDKAVMADFEPKTLQEIADAPVSTLQGLSEVKAQNLTALYVKTVSDLAELKYCLWAESILHLAEFEEVAN